MSIMKDFFSNTRKPVGVMGKMMTAGMNSGHAKMSQWGRSNLPAMRPERIADLGCGGGRNAAELMKQFPEAKITALDYSEVSVAQTAKFNRGAVQSGRCRVVQGDVSHLPLKDGEFDLVTAFETVYFWPGPVQSFREVHRVLRGGGRFLIVNESDGTNEKDQKWLDMIDGMRIYTADEMCAMLKTAGFSKITVFRRKENHWAAFLAEKA